MTWTHLHPEMNLNQYATHEFVRQLNHETYKESIDTSTDIISNQLSDLSLFIAICWLLFAIIAVILWIWIQWMFNNIKKIREEVESTEKFMKGKDDKLYQQLKENEISHI